MLRLRSWASSSTTTAYCRRRRSAAISWGGSGEEKGEGGVGIFCFFKGGIS